MQLVWPSVDPHFDELDYQHQRSQCFMDLQMTTNQEDTEYLRFLIDVIRNAGMQEGDKLTRSQVFAIGGAENMHLYEVEKSLRLAHEFEWFETSDSKELVLTKTGAEAAA
ncbi:hypothetical protein HFO58_10655 [Rhizobium leguminosarum]|uniref:hypothetical protein n=1 Tax=Rhizobium leguminosarum TaxID=384 RepID=UPI001C94232E|nr:hypothetical protein [Rhizobium leguminosarum]MBY5533623.1 hypothetical protein [Rhizobium leguminosarum]